MSHSLFHAKGPTQGPTATHCACLTSSTTGGSILDPNSVLSQHSPTPLEDGPLDQAQPEPSQLQTNDDPATSHNSNNNPLIPAPLTPTPLTPAPRRSPRLKVAFHSQPSKSPRSMKKRQGTKHQGPSFIPHDQVSPVTLAQAFAALHGSGLQVTDEIIVMIEATFRQENSTITHVHNSVLSLAMGNFKSLRF
jgi:hypothetical protein